MQSVAEEGGVFEHPQQERQSLGSPRVLEHTLEDLVHEMLAVVDEVALSSLLNDVGEHVDLVHLLVHLLEVLLVENAYLGTSWGEEGEPKLYETEFDWIQRLREGSVSHLECGYHLAFLLLFKAGISFSERCIRVWIFFSSDK